MSYLVPPSSGWVRIEVEMGQEVYGNPGTRPLLVIKNCALRDGLIYSQIIAQVLLQPKLETLNRKFQLLLSLDYSEYTLEVKAR